MPSSRDKGTRRVAVRFLLALLALAATFLGSRALILHGARSALTRWTEAGLPGSPPSGRGPFADLNWPPHVIWSDARWNDGEALELSCSRLEVSIAPLELLRGRIRLREVRIRELRVAASKPISPWTDLLISTLGDSAAPALDRPGHPLTVKIEVDTISFDSSSVRLASLSGWAWTPSPSSWAFLALAGGGSGGSMVVRGSGRGAAGWGSVILDFQKDDRALHLDARLPSGGDWSYTVSGRDDGVLCSDLLSRRIADLRVRGTIDFVLTRGEAHEALEGEAQFRQVRVAREDAADQESWVLDGTLCLSDGRLSLQDMEIEGEEGAGTRLLLEAELPVAGSSVEPGRIAVSGTLRGSAAGLEGTLHRSGGGLVLRAPCLQSGGARTGPVDLRWTAAGGATPIPHLEGNVRLGSGTIAIHGGSGSLSDPLLLRGVSVPLAEIRPWLPFRTPGDWSGRVDADASLRFAPDGWRWGGTASLTDGEVRGLPLLDEIGALWGDRRGALRFERLRARWSYGLGRFIADSLSANSGGLSIRGSLVYATDSVLALLELTPRIPGDRPGSFLRLLGGDAGVLEVGIAGRSASPEVVLLDGRSSTRWKERIASLRRSAIRS